MGICLNLHSNMGSFYLPLGFFISQWCWVLVKIDRIMDDEKFWQKQTRYIKGVLLEIALFPHC